MTTTTAECGHLTIRGLEKSFRVHGQSLPVLRGINLDIRGGESLAIVGASGSGKTTLLRILAGLDTPDEGGVLIDGTPAAGLGAGRAIIFQEPRLLPWLSVLGNVAFGLEVRGIPAREAAERARRYLRLVGLARATLRRHGAARRNRPRPGRTPGDPVAGRAVGGARRHDPDVHAGGTDAYLARGAGDDDPRHSRSGGGDLSRRPGADPAGTRLRAAPGGGDRSALSA